MVILGIDPGFQFAGFCILKKDGPKTILLDAGYLKMQPTKAISVRIEQFYAFFKQKIITCHVNHIALETPFLGKNAQNFLKLGYLRGIIHLLAAQHTLTMHEFAPQQIKRAITGFGGASKEQVSRVILNLFVGLKQPEKYDVTDAIAVSVCGLWHTQQFHLQTTLA